MVPASGSGTPNLKHQITAAGRLLWHGRLGGDWSAILFSRITGEDAVPPDPLFFLNPDSIPRRTSKAQKAKEPDS